MKVKHIIFILTLFAHGVAFGQYDLVIVGGTPGGIMAGISAARLGKTSVILERTNHIGGLPANGLGATDIATRGATTGLFSEFIGRVKKYYVTTYGENSKQAKDCSDGFHFEPAVAERILEQMLAEHKDKITVLKMRQFDAFQKNITLRNDGIEAIRILNRESQAQEEYTGKVFLDATYEGDLGAAANVPFRLGREGHDEFNEPGAGIVYKYWGGAEGEGTTLQGDNAVQSYNYRLCLTNQASNRVEIKKPAMYNRDEYVSLINDVWTGRHTGVQMLGVTEAMLEENRKHIAKGNPSKIPGDVWGIARITNMVSLPNEKTDGNNQHMAFISTDLPEENWPWPTSGWAWRDAYAQRLRSYIEGLFYFAQNDKELPQHFRKAAKEWGFAKDEYTDNGNFPRQVYVREGRRFEGEYFFTAKDATAVTPGQRPPVHAGSITASHYALDSHAVRKREPNRIHLDGFLSYPSQVYTVPFGVMVPKILDNLLLPVPVSGSHIGFSTLRMEPCWMAIGQAAGTAAALAIDKKVKVRNVDLRDLQSSLLDQSATLLYYKDIHAGDPDFKMVQVLGLLGYLPAWEARLNDAVDAPTLLLWETLSHSKLAAEPGKTSRKDVLQFLYKNL
ncbi:FAD-dependent oxidoreductase [Chryseolinea lacunae]|uniref:FAD-dependent oxidoreductase n=1 Tax=Chryseolinea lacunae TaxID=2801331 RepID=A0ABS1KKM1_9BACT|nr:FAD-dependent oxidoreductase [Chryseolinea lacunae]MBL0740010.1 FAD-dependent oxidoreductase [Chryseolinea lacunae]